MKEKLEMSDLTNRKLTTKRLLTGFLVGLGFMGLMASAVKAEKQNAASLGHDNLRKESVENRREALAYGKNLATKTYCPQCEEQYNNLLDKAIQEEGRKQLGQRPSNQRLTLEEMKLIDWTKVDFSEVMKKLQIKLAGNLGK